METKKVIHSEIYKLSTGRVTLWPSESNPNFPELNEKYFDAAYDWENQNDGEWKNRFETAERFGHAEIIDGVNRELEYVVEQIKGHAHEDLKDIWGRLDEMENRLAALENKNK